MQPRPSIHWPSLLMLVFCILATFGLFAGAALSAFAGLYTFLDPTLEINRTPAFFLAAGLGLSGLLLLPAISYSIHRLSGHAIPPPRPVRLNLWQFLLIILPWPLALWGGQQLMDRTTLAWLFAIPLYLLAAGLPILLLVRLGGGGLPPGSRLRAWGIFALGLAGGSAIIMFFEIIFFLGLAILSVLYLALNPDLLNELSILAQRLMLAPTDKALLTLMLPYLLKPGAIALALATVSIIVPLIEEPLKVLGLWLLSKKISTPAEGFALGVLSGAGYALFETLGQGSAASAGWGMMMLARFGTGLVHVLNGGLMGWGLALAFRERRYGRLLGIFGLALLIHGLWNALAVAFALGELAQGMAIPAVPGNLYLITCIGLAVDAAIMLAALCIINRRLRGTV